MSDSIIPLEQRLDLVFHALANQTRRALLAQLLEGPHMVTELAKSYKISLNAISKHLLVLERAGLVDRKVEGRVHSCSLQAGPMNNVDQWLKHYEGFWQSNLDSLAKYAEEKHAETICDKDTR